MVRFRNFKLLATVVVLFVCGAIFLGLSTQNFDEENRIGKSWRPHFQRSNRKAAKEQNGPGTNSDKGDTDEKADHKNPNLNSIANKQRNKNDDLVEDDLPKTESRKINTKGGREVKSKIIAVRTATTIKDDKNKNNKDYTSRLPGCIVIGFSHCGTETLTNILNLHPEIVAATEDSQYFTMNLHRGLEWYRKQMPKSLPSQITVDSTPSCIMSSQVLDRIRKFNSTVKVIVMVCDPITRLLAEYSSDPRVRADKQMTFRDFCGNSVKSRQVERVIDFATPVVNVLDRFPKKQVLMLSKEDLDLKPLSVLRQVESFLEVGQGWVKDDFVQNKQKGAQCFNTEKTRYLEVIAAVNSGSENILDEDTGCLGSSKNRFKHPGIDEKFFDVLISEVESRNGKLFKLIGGEFDWTTSED